MDQPGTHLVHATLRRTGEPRFGGEPSPRGGGFTRLRDDVATLGLLAAAVALSGLWIVGLVTVVRWLV